MNKTIAVVIAFVVVAAGSFWGGTYYQGFQIRQSFANRQFGGGGFGGPQVNRPALAAADPARAARALEMAFPAAAPDEAPEARGRWRDASIKSAGIS